MKIYHTLESFQKLSYAVVTSGTFDGVHLGHQKILARLKEIANLNGGETVVLTFWPHPRMVVSEDSQGLQLLSTLEEKIELLTDLGIDHLLIVPFTRSFSELSCEDYIQQILVDQIGTKKLVIGYDHRFGRNREGNFDFLKNNAQHYGFKVEEIPREDIEETAISSTRIRHTLTSGHIEEANSLLGRPYSISGTVVKGKQLGRQLGFPTANVQVSSFHKLVPNNGVYIIRAVVDGISHEGMLNIGTRPTVDGRVRSIEANIFNFERDIYGEKLKIEFLSYLRPERKFDGLEALTAQIAEDKKVAKAFFAGNK
jgi:riboflavin kinase/FMN adenylyltransferase